MIGTESASPGAEVFGAGTLGILSMAAERSLVDLAEAFERIKQTSFHYRQETMDQLLADAS